MWDSRPVELIYNITGYLDFGTLACLWCTSKRMHSLSSDQNLWESLYQRDFPEFYEEARSLSHTYTFQKLLEFTYRISLIAPISRAIYEAKQQKTSRGTKDSPSVRIRLQ